MRPGGEKRLENALALIQSYAASRIADREFEPLPARFRAFSGYQAAGNRQSTALWHGLDGIGKEVEQDLFHLGDVCLHSRNGGIATPHRYSGVGTLPLHHIEYVIAQGAEIAGNQM